VVLPVLVIRGTRLTKTVSDESSPTKARTIEEDTVGLLVLGVALDPWLAPWAPPVIGEAGWPDAGWPEEELPEEELPEEEEEEEREEP
jgi:hypothetical protein